MTPRLLRRAMLGAGVSLLALPSLAARADAGDLPAIWASARNAPVERDRRARRCRCECAHPERRHAQTHGTTDKDYHYGVSPQALIALRLKPARRVLSGRDRFGFVDD